MRTALAPLTLALWACDNTPTTGATGKPPSPDLVQAAQQAEAQKKAQEKAQISANPASVLETSGVEVFNKGIINPYRQLTKLTVLNKGHFALRNVQGSVEWFDPSGNTLGSTSFSLTGSIPAGDTKRYSTEDQTMSSSTLQGKGEKYRLKFTHVDIID
jgi:hypothetical protein